MENETSSDSGAVEITSDKDTTVHGDIVGRDKISYSIYVVKNGEAIPKPSDSPNNQKTPLSDHYGLESSLEKIIYITQQQYLLLIFISSILGSLVGGFLWSFINILLGWVFHQGGSGSEPHGVSAFVWGSVSVLPVIILAFISFSKYLSINKKTIQKSVSLISIYIILEGLGAMLFYDFGFRQRIEALSLGYGVQEILIVLIWAFILSAASSLPFLALFRSYKDILNTWYLLYQIPLAIIVSFLGVVLTLMIKRPISEVELMRGLFAGIGFRFGLFWGIAFSISRNYRKG